MLARNSAVSSLLCFVALIAAGPRHAFSADEFAGTLSSGDSSFERANASRGLRFASSPVENGNSSNSSDYYYRYEATASVDGSASVNGSASVDGNASVDGSASVGGNATANVGQHSRQRALRYPTKWLARLFYDTLVDFTVSPDIGSSACQRQTDMYIRHLANDSLWAVQMSDSWSRYPNGLLVGTSHQMGVYEECVAVQKPVQGKYCIPEVKLKSTTGQDFGDGKPDEPQLYDHAWREILGFVNKDLKFHRNNIKFGICIPDSCSAQDLEISLKREFDKNLLPHQVEAKVHVKSILCTTGKETYPIDGGFYLTSVLIGFILLFCCLSTAYHLIAIMRSENGKTNWDMPEALRAFSVIRNGRDLIKYDRNNDLNIFNGLKTVTMFLVFFGHKFLYFVINPIMFGTSLEQIYITGPVFLLTCMNLVDPFFYITGYLIYALSKSQFNKLNSSWCRIPMVFVYKYLRVIPAYVMMMLLTAFIIPHLGNGPFWASTIWTEGEKCKTYWWANLLVISNYIKVENQCLIAGWYISCLLQFVAIGTVVTYFCVRHRKFGIFLIVLLLCVSLVIPFALTYTNRVYGMVRVMYSFLLNPANSVEFRDFYRSFYMRGIPFYAGMLAAILTEEMKKREIKFSMSVIYIGTIIISTIAMYIQMYGGKFYDPNRPYNAIEQGLYATLSHCTWTIILFWITLCHFSTGFGPLEKVFNNRLVVPFGRLSFSVYLVNITIMMMIESRQRVAISPSEEFLIDGWIFAAVRTYMVGALLYLTVEAPFGLLIKQMVYGNPSKKKNGTSTIENRTNTNNTQQITDQKESTRL